jgi:hypothetical protein
MVSFSGAASPTKDVIDNLNVLDYDYFFRITGQYVAGRHLDPPCLSSTKLLTMASTGSISSLDWVSTCGQPAGSEGPGYHQA